MAVWRLLYGVRAVILRLGGYGQYLLELIGVHSSVQIPLDRSLYLRCGFQISTSFCGAAVLKLKRTVGGGWKILIIFHCFCGPYLIKSEYTASSAY